MSRERKANCRYCDWFRCKDPGRCPAKERECNNCGIKGHFARSEVCKERKKGPEKVARVEDSKDSEGSEVMTRRIKETRAKLATWDDEMEDEDEIEVEVRLSNPTGRGGKAIRLLADTGIRKTILNRRD